MFQAERRLLHRHPGLACGACRLAQHHVIQEFGDREVYHGATTPRPARWLDMS
jgi:hypothetical protein